MKREQILIETPQFIVINKTAGFQVEKNRFERAMEDFVEDYLKKTIRKPFIGIVHRLDKVTSGALLFAKKKSTLKELNKQIELRKIKKTYLAIVDKTPPKDKAFLKHFLERDFKNKKAILHETKKKGTKECRMRYRKITEKDGQFLLEITPETGRFHQIRAQLASIGCPIIGDKKYGSKIQRKKQEVALHSFKLSFHDELNKKHVFVEAPLPDGDLWEGFR